MENREVRLIDANALKEQAFADPETGEGIVCVEDIDKAPTIDPESLRPHGHWEWFEEWNPSTTEHPRECEECGWRCGRCKTALEDIVGGYWDNPDEEPKLHYCPECGAKMDDIEEDDFDPGEDWEASRCYECGAYGDDYSTDENGEMVCNCDRCPYNSMNKED